MPRSSGLQMGKPQLVKTIPCDIGTEFAKRRKTEQRQKCEVYSADPYCAWQKGTKENLNGLLRKFNPKGENPRALLLLL